MLGCCRHECMYCSHGDCTARQAYNDTNGVLSYTSALYASAHVTAEVQSWKCMPGKAAQQNCNSVMGPCFSLSDTPQCLAAKLLPPPLHTIKMAETYHTYDFAFQLSQLSGHVLQHKITSSCAMRSKVSMAAHKTCAVSGCSKGTPHSLMSGHGAADTLW